MTRPRSFSTQLSSLLWLKLSMRPPIAIRTASWNRGWLRTAPAAPEPRRDASKFLHPDRFARGL